MSRAAKDVIQAKKKERLEDAFQLFNELSKGLTDSYQELQDQVSELNHQLTVAQSARLKTLTEKEQLANQLHSLLDTLPGGVIVLDHHGCIVRGNRVASDLFGSPLLGVSWSEVVSRCLQESSDHPHERLLKSGKFVNISSCTWDENSESGKIILVTDVSEVRNLQNIVNHQKRLSAMGEMVASLAHQIRTPLSTAIVYGAHLGKPELDVEKRQRFSKKLLNRLKYLDRQVNDMLLFARDGRVTMNEITLDKLVAKTSEAVAMFLVDFDVSFKIDNRVSARKISCNQDAIIGSILNLVSNAAEAMKNQGDLLLQINESGSGIQFVLHDQGPGIEESIRERLFEPFFTTRSNGTGLGLAVVDSVVRLHGGRAWCGESFSAGAAFYMEIPGVGTAQPLSGGVFTLEHKVEVA